LNSVQNRRATVSRFMSYFYADIAMLSSPLPI